MVSKRAAEVVVAGLKSEQITGAALRQKAMNVLSELPGYDWCGIYVLNEGELSLAEFVGAPTEHTLIPVGRGVCGTAVAEDRNQIVGDVTKSDNYLACSIDTKSEIVVLIRRNGNVVGQIDIDSHSTNAFDNTDEQLLQQVADILAAHWE